jgi:UDP-glucoronosyl and UDP-glucosyl transferase
MFFPHYVSITILHALINLTTTIQNETNNTVVIKVIWKLTLSHREALQSLLGTSLLLSNLEKEGSFIFMPWIPQNDLLGQRETAMFISHCGMQGMLD